MEKKVSNNMRNGEMGSNVKVKFENIVDVYSYDSIEDAKKNENGKQELHTHNDIHPENMSYLLASAIMCEQNNQLYTMGFGNGGSQTDNIGRTIILPPNTIGRNISLYNMTYSKNIANGNASNIDSENNNITLEHIVGNNYTDVVVRCTLNRFEPSGQEVLDTNTPESDQYVFDEIALIDKLGNMVCHTCFNPIQKTSNRVIVVVYRVRIIVI